HLYLNHLPQAELLLSREPRPLPRVVLSPEVADIFSFGLDDITLEGYNPHDSIPAPVAV
ncbi:MAG TPA: thymidylate synthase, partial [Candidatus Omnitrophota bacterium]|nr:thymidylate synthase [Candidatus Omnitrophota bacterium]